MEKAVRLNVSAQANAQVEAKFRDIKKFMTEGKDVKEVEDKSQELMKQLRQLADQMDGTNTGSFGVFLSSFLIIVREGFEAILILGAIIAYLFKSEIRQSLGRGSVLALWFTVFLAVYRQEELLELLRLTFQLLGS